MSETGPNSRCALGFLTVVDSPQHGLFGGFLLLNAGGRPLEFHCTAPVKPNRAQRILYGPTLLPYLYGEQIGHTLVKKSKITPSIVLTDNSAVLAVRDHISLPTVVVLPRTFETTAGRHRIDPPHVEGGSLVTFTHAGFRLGMAPGYAEDQRAVGEQLAQLDDDFDLSEPFERIREAIEEAQSAGAA
ncbi:MAG: hypothetical protein IID44_05660 [Planctomycetes bacterium]|nr:hypothetical protein [Planctomycetota bacterium]